jgi:hypothetical protein
MRKGPSLKSIKRIPILIFVLIGVYFLFNILLCYRTIGRKITINASLRYRVEKTISEVDIMETTL